MMYLKQFPDICREMGFAVKEDFKIVTLSIPDIHYSIDINKKLFLEDLELMLDSYSEECEAIAISEADDTGMFQTEVNACHQHAEYLEVVLEKLLDKLRKEVEKARLYSASCYNFPIVMKQIDTSCYKAYALAKSNDEFLVQEYIIDLDDVGRNDEKKIRAQFEELFKRASVVDSYRLLAELSIEVGYFVPPCGILFKKIVDAMSYIKAKTGVDLKVVRPDKTNLDMIRTVDKFHLAMLLSHIRANSKDYPTSTTDWCEWLDKNWNAILCV